MSGRTNKDVSDSTKPPLILWHLLSLDAPVVATLWTWFIARANRVPLQMSSLVAMGAAVWTLYAADRLLDAQSPGHDALEARHYFHQEHRSGFMAGIAIASVVLAVLLPRIPETAIRLYLILGGLVFGYFVIIHATRSAHRLPKEIAVGVCFAAATFIPTVARVPELRLVLLPPALLLAAVCSLNCLFIYAWEHPLPNGQTPHPITAVALRYLPVLAVGVAVASGLLAVSDRHAPRLLYVSVMLSTLLLLMLHLRSHKFAALELRAAADLALLTPLLAIPFL
ncbi:hypothetical protein [Edaphobacter modestus]|uniref:4-hydroxybenzoate polyprenyltransferase n=1 Tax=Edaphobacter modestus TaxID=388466 RepID=A0A4V2G4E6_9BACT|nr:hypothetical protein [Edaphobacter modestus]RZU40576.1 hypothetical protein BDD14_2045 [Edaphobacter modestus]